ncbi:hypothetical protein WME79_34910 [Sorangium sp. So ce726]|uniref:hypothetical protein n=1 Tax=Sorangium sp. So ce726 TaxID=3133319 RepID=UPI003F5EC42A
MSLFRKTALPLMLLGAAAVLGGCAGEAPPEGDDGHEAQPEAADAIDPEAAEAVGTAQQAAQYSTWRCIGQYVNTGNYFNAGEVTIWWGHGAVDAIWACNAWRQACQNNCVTVDLIRRFEQ